MMRWILIVFPLVFAQLTYAAEPDFLNQDGAGAVTRTSAVEHEALLARRASILRMGDPKYFDLANANVRSYDVLAATALRGCGSADWRQFMIEVPSKPSDNDPVEMFSLPPLVRYLYQFGSCLSTAEKKELLANFAKRQNILGHGTLNHAVIKASSWYLLAQFFPEATWTEISTNQSYSSSQLMALLKQRLVSRTKRIFHSGQYEWLSPNYSLLNIYPLLNLIDFASDPTIKQNAQDEAILEISILRVHSFDGVIVPPLTRKNYDQRNATEKSLGYAPAITQQLLWYYYGDPAGFGLYEFRSGLGSYFISMLAISSWLPPDVVLGLGIPSDAVPIADHTVKAITPEFTIWGDPTSATIFGDSLITNDFSIGTGNLNFDPLGYSGHIQTFSILLKSVKSQNEIECYQPFWHSAAGEDAWSTDRSSPFQQMYRYDDSSVVMVFDTPKVDPWKATTTNRFWSDRSTNQDHLLQLVTCRFARDFDEIIQESNWIFAREGGSFVAMATLKGTNDYDHAHGELLKNFKIVKIHEAKTALFFRVDHQTANLSFEQFQNNVRASLPDYHSDSSSISLIEKNGTKTEVIFDLHKRLSGGFWSALPRIVKDGRPFIYEDSYVVESNQMTLKNGILTLRSPGGELTLRH